MSHISRISSGTQGLDFQQCFLRMSLAVCIITALKLVVTTSRFSSSVISDANFPPIVAWNDSEIAGSTSLSKVNLSLVFLGLLVFFSHTHHQKVVITSYIRSCERPCFDSVDPGSEPFLCQDVVDLTVMYSVRCMPGPSSQLMLQPF